MPRRIRTTRVYMQTQSIAREMENMQFSEYLGSPAGWAPNVDAFLFDDHFEIRVELAGVPRNAIELAVFPRALTIEGVRKRPQCGAVEGCRQTLAMEIPAGPFHREIRLPLPVDPEKVSARQENGVMRIFLPLANSEPSC